MVAPKAPPIIENYNGIPLNFYNAPCLISSPPAFDSSIATLISY
jgi:hypothetical protein